MGKDLEARIQHIEDMEAIRYLKHYYYCCCVDRTVAGDKAAIEETLSRFNDDIVADFTGFPLMEGLDAVSQFYKEGVPSCLRWCQHRVTNEVINIVGDSASAIWYIDCPADFIAGNPTGVEGSGYIAGRYHEEYIRENGQWKWTKIVALLDLQTEYSRNWQGAKQIQCNR